MPRRRASGAVAALLVAVFALLGGCGGDSGPSHTLRLGYFPNITHGPALVGLREDVFATRVRAATVRPAKFATGTEAVAAMLAGSLDASYMGMGPVITTLSRAPGSIRVLAGVGEAGAVLVVRRGAGIRSLADLRGRTIGFPGYGNTQDLTLRLMLGQAGISTRRGNAQAHLVRIHNAALRSAFSRAALDAALVPEPWGTVLQHAGLADVLVPADRVMGGRTPTTILVVRTAYARQNPQAVAQLVAANREVVELARDPARVVDAYVALVKSNTLDRDTLLRAVRANIVTTRVDRSATADLLRAAGDAGYLSHPVPLATLLP